MEPLSYDVWTPLRGVSDGYTEDGVKPTNEQVMRKLDAATEAAAEVLFTSSAEELREGAVAAKLAHDRIVHGENVAKTSPGYQAGRAAALTDVLAHVAARTASAELETLSSRNPFAAMLAALADGPLSNKDLADRVDLSAEQTCRNLGRLRRVGAISPQPRGREVYNRLTPAGRLLVEAGIRTQKRQPIEQTRIEDLSAYRLERYAPTDNPVAPPPRLKTA